MSKFCEVCKQMNKCNFCVKYGYKGVYLYLEQVKYEHKNIFKKPENDKKVVELGIMDKLQLQSLGNRNLFYTNDVSKFKK